MDWKNQFRNRERLIRFLELHSVLYRAIFHFHDERVKEGSVGRGHSIDHDLAVCSHALMLGFALQDEQLAHKAGAASLMHSFDRFGQTKEKVHGWIALLPAHYTAWDQAEIAGAIFRHDQSNKDADAKFDVADLLADSDKLACLMAYNPLRSGQFDHHLPAVDVDHLHTMSPGANYKRHNVALDDIYGMFEWFEDKERWFKTPLAREIAADYERSFRSWLNVSISQFETIGLSALPRP